MATDEQQVRTIARCRVWEHRMSTNVSIEVVCEVEVPPDVSSEALVGVLKSLEDRFAPHLPALEAFADETPPGEVVMSFGKYRDRKLADIIKIEPGYIDWLAKDSHNYTIKRAAQRLLSQAPVRPVREPLPMSPPDDEELPF